MLIKRAYAASSPGDPRIEIVRPGEGVKTARIEDPVRRFIDALKPSKDHTYALVNAMGYSEYFGPNSNRDWYGYNEHLNFNGLLHDWPDVGRDIDADRAKAKTWPYGYPTFNNATVFAHHKNDDPKHGFGRVLLAFANHAMKRVELVLEINNDEAERRGHGSFLDRMDSGERCDVSMGTRIPWDACSLCTDWLRVREAWARFDPKRHKHPGVPVLEEHARKRIQGIARTRQEYCPCQRHRSGQVTPDGQKVFVYNDIIVFFDISLVMIGADRTAKVMWSLPSPGRRAMSSEIIAPVVSALQALIGGKAASIEKDIPGGVARVLGEAESRPSAENIIAAARKIAPPKAVLSTLARLGVCASPREFAAAVTGEARDFDPGGDGRDDSMAVSAKDVMPALLHALSPILSSHSSFSPCLQPRLVGEIHIVKRAGASDADLARKYAGYRLSLLRQAPELFRAGGEEGAKIAAEIPGLLLGPAGVIQWISSHLNPDLGSDAVEAVTKLATMATRTEDLPKLAMALDAIVGTEKTSVWEAIRATARAAKDL